MLKLNHTFIRGGAMVAFASLFINAAMADISVERLNTYKANRLVPQELSIEVGGKNDTDITFTSNLLTWGEGNAINKASLLNKFGEMTKADWDAYNWGENAWLTEKIPDETMPEWAWQESYKANPEAMAFAEYLWLVQSGQITPDDPELTPELAKETKMRFFQQDQGRDFTHAHEYALTMQFDGTEDFSSVGLYGLNMTGCKGLTGAQVAASRYLGVVYLPDLAFTGDETFTASTLRDVYFANTTGLKGTQIAGKDLDNSILPAVDFTGVDFTGVGITNADFSKCTGLTGAQLVLAGDLYGVKLPSKGIDFTGADMAGVGLANLDLSNCTGIDGKMLSTAGNFANTKFPNCDLSKASFIDKDLTGCDFSLCTGMTGKQFAEAKNLGGAKACKLPAVDFTGVEAFTASFAGVDLSNCTGLTAKQLLSNEELRRKDYATNPVKLSQAQFDALKDDIAASLPSAKSNPSLKMWQTRFYVKVNGKTQCIMGTATN